MGFVNSSSLSLRKSPEKKFSSSAFACLARFSLSSYSFL
jgi:hypothetical protein